MAEKGAEVGIVGSVVNDEARVDRRSTAAVRYIDRMRMAPRPRRFFVYGDAMLPAEEPCGGHPRDARPDNGNIEILVCSVHELRVSPRPVICHTGSCPRWYGVFSVSDHSARQNSLYAE